MAKNTQKTQPKEEGRSKKFNAIFKSIKGKNPEEMLNFIESNACMLKPYQVQKLIGAVPVKNTA